MRRLAPRCGDVSESPTLIAAAGLDLRGTCRRSYLSGNKGRWRSSKVESRLSPAKATRRFLPTKPTGRSTILLARNMDTGLPQTAWRARPFFLCFLLAFVLWFAAAPTIPSIRSVVHGWAGFLVAVLCWSVFFLARRAKASNVALFRIFLIAVVLSPYLVQFLAYYLAPRFER